MLDDTSFDEGESRVFRFSSEASSDFREIRNTHLLQQIGVLG